MTENDDLYIKHLKIQNRWVSGFYQNIRNATIWITYVVFFAAPWITWHDRQAILFDIAARRFYLFNITFFPQDFYLLVLLAISAALALIVVTNLAGRIWCGYTCPQTVWTRSYMWIEYMLEGDRSTRLKRDKNPWDSATLYRRITKHILWLMIALVTAITFVGYFTPIKSLLTGHISLINAYSIGFFTLATYLNAGWMREQVCLYICPYARFQSVMFDQNTMVISYDYNRGEPRGSRKIGAKPNDLGDCIDCQLCVQVCPTGIDIRNGLQMACIGCAACVDACNDVMDKMKYKRGLIRYDTENRLQNKRVRIIRPRLIASIALLVTIFSVFGLLLLKRIPLQFNVMHDHRNLYRIAANGNTENYYLISVSNMSQDTDTYAISFDQNSNIIYIGKNKITLPAGATEEIPVTLSAKPETIKQFSLPIRFSIQSTTHPEIALDHQANFFSPSS